MLVSCISETRVQKKVYRLLNSCFYTLGLQFKFLFLVKIPLAMIQSVIDNYSSLVDTKPFFLDNSYFTDHSSYLTYHGSK